MRALALAALLVAAPAAAREPMMVASELGAILASEAHCGLVFDEGAVAAYVEANVPAGDMSFPGLLDMMMGGVAANLADQSAAQKSAHCTQVRRAAKQHGFVD